MDYKNHQFGQKEYSISWLEKPFQDPLPIQQLVDQPVELNEQSTNKPHNFKK